MLPPHHHSLPPPPSPQQPYPAYYNSHYVQAYSQPSYSQPDLTAAHYPVASTSYANNTIFQQQTSKKPNFPTQSCSSWYQPGSSQCSYPSCIFTGSSKSVEIHMMDRHLIYPPGWEKRQKKTDWDADPSLKGKPVPIQGTNIVLDSPEILEAWIAERKKRFPTSERVEEKKRKMEEAISRGQLDLTDSGLRANKRRRVENIDSFNDKNKHQGRPTKGRVRTRQNDDKPRVPDSGWPARAPKNALHKVEQMVVSSKTGSCSEGDENDAPESLSSKIVHTKGPISQHYVEINTHDRDCSAATGMDGEDIRNFKKRQTQQVKAPPMNPFASRPTLLRNLLLPEIRITISNLSQAIRFLVDNDFLHDVEMKPGQTVEENKIQILAVTGDKVGSSSDD